MAVTVVVDGGSYMAALATAAVVMVAVAAVMVVAAAAVLVVAATAVAMAAAMAVATEDGRRRLGRRWLWRRRWW